MTVGYIMEHALVSLAVLHSHLHVGRSPLGFHTAAGSASAVSSEEFNHGCNAFMQAIKGASALRLRGLLCRHDHLHKDQRIVISWRRRWWRASLSTNPFSAHTSTSRMAPKKASKSSS